jgi:hypothetical protein
VIIVGELAGRYFLDIYAPLSGVMIGPFRLVFAGVTGRPFLSDFQNLSRKIPATFSCFENISITHILQVFFMSIKNGVVFLKHEKQRL